MLVPSLSLATPFLCPFNNIRIVINKRKISSVNQIVDINNGVFLTILYQYPIKIRKFAPKYDRWQIFMNVVPRFGTTILYLRHRN